MSHQLTLEISDDTYHALLQRAQQQGRTPEELVKSALARAVQALDGGALLRWSGALASGIPDAAERHDHYLSEALLGEMSGQPDA
jgi:hypothetical protein